MEGEPGIRAFMCIDIPEEIRGRMRAFVDGHGWKWARPVGAEQLHITLFFFPNISLPQAARLAAMMDAAGSGGFDLTLKGLEAFTPRSPRVLAAKVCDCPPLMALHAKLSEAVAGLGLELEKRPFSPHATLARLRYVDMAASTEVRRVVEENAGTEFGSFSCDAITLKKSVLTQSGPVYEVLHSAQLG